MPIQILPPDEAAKRARERVVEWKRQKEIDGAKARAEEKTAANSKEENPKPDENQKSKSKRSSEEQKKLNAQLIEAAEKGNRKKAKELIKKGADVNAKNDSSNTVLMVASSYGYTKMAELLIRNGADVNAIDEHGCTALLCTMNSPSESHIETTELLIQHGASVNAIYRENDEKPLSLALRLGLTEIAELLRAHGAIE
jgi:ankyrin repeat protein